MVCIRAVDKRAFPRPGKRSSMKKSMNMIVPLRFIDWKTVFPAMKQKPAVTHTVGREQQRQAEDITSFAEFPAILWHAQQLITGRKMNQRNAVRPCVRYNNGFIFPVSQHNR